MSGLSVADVVGLLGAALIVGAYLLLQIGRLDARSMAYSAINGLGAAGILVSLIFDFNLGAFTIEAFWLAISLYGMVRAWRPERASEDVTRSSEPSSPQSSARSPDRPELD